MSENKETTHASARQAVFWVLAARPVDRLLSIASIAILARVLSPADFGLVAMAGSVVALVEVLSAFGFDWALIRLADPRREHYDTAWTLRMLTGAFVCLVMVAIAWPAAKLFDQPVVAWIIAAMGVNAVLAAVENIWMAEYRRQSRFEPEFKLRLASKIAGFIVAVGFALATRSYWALVLGVTASRLASTAMSYWLHAGRPRWNLSHRAELLSFSVWLLIGNVVETLRNRFAEMWLGRNADAKQVGWYSLSFELATLASNELAAPINRAIFSKYSERRDSIPALRDGYLRVSGVLWLIGVPAAVGIGVCARQVIAVMLGDQWDAAVPVLQILAVAGLLGIMEGNTRYVYWALGRSKFVTMLAIVGAVGFVTLTVILGARHGILGVAWAQVVAALLVVILNMWVLFRTLRLGLMEFVARKFRILLASAAMGYCVVVLGDWLAAGEPLAHWLQLGLMVAAGVTSYGVVLFALWQIGGRPVGPEQEVYDVVRSAGVRGMRILRRNSR
jgi:O-antigen/teichoic acid export membrane protein